MNELMNADFYNQIRTILEAARSRVYTAANTAMVQAYWNIGKRIVEQQGGKERAEYGVQLIKELSKRLTADFGKGFTETNLKYMRQFYLAFPIGHALSDQLSWTHYRLLIRVKDEKARWFYAEECEKPTGASDNLNDKSTVSSTNGCWRAEPREISATR